METVEETVGGEEAIVFALVGNVLGDGVGVRRGKYWLSRGEEGMFGVARVAVVLSILIAIL